MTDNLELFFKKRLKDESIGGDGWNVPSDDVWAKVLPVIQKTAGFFIPWKYFYISGIALIVAVTIGFFWLDGVNENTDINTDQGALYNTRMEHVDFNSESGFAVPVGLTNLKTKGIETDDKEQSDIEVYIKGITADELRPGKETAASQLEKPVYMEVLSCKSIDYLHGALEKQLPQKLRETNLKFKSKDVPMPNFFW